MHNKLTTQKANTSTATKTRAATTDECKTPHQRLASTLALAFVILVTLPLFLQPGASAQSAGPTAPPAAQTSPTEITSATPETANTPSIEIPQADANGVITQVVAARMFKVELSVITEGADQLEVVPSRLTRIDGTAGALGSITKSILIRDAQSQSNARSHAFWILTIEGELPQYAPYESRLLFAADNYSKEYRLVLHRKPLTQPILVEEEGGRVTFTVNNENFERTVHIRNQDASQAMSNLSILVESFASEDDRPLEAEQFNCQIVGAGQSVPCGTQTLSLDVDEQAQVIITGKKLKATTYLSRLSLTYAGGSRLIPFTVKRSPPGAPTATPQALLIEDIGTVGAERWLPAWFPWQFELGHYVEAKVHIKESVNQDRALYYPAMGSIHIQSSEEVSLTISGEQKKLFVQDDLTGKFVPVSPVPDETAALTVTPTPSASPTRSPLLATTSPTAGTPSVGATGIPTQSEATPTPLVTQPASSYENTLLGGNILSQNINSWFYVSHNINYSSVRAPSDSVLPAPNSAAIAPGASTWLLPANGDATFSYRVAGLAPGTYKGQVTVSGPDGVREVKEFTFLIKDGCLLPLLVIALGVLATTLLREVNGSGLVKLNQERATYREQQRIGSRQKRYAKYAGSNESVWNTFTTELQDLRRDVRDGVQPAAFDTTFGDIHSRAELYYDAIQLRKQIQDNLDAYLVDIEEFRDAKADFSDRLHHLNLVIEIALTTPGINDFTAVNQHRIELRTLAIEVRAKAIMLLAAYLVKQLGELATESPELQGEANSALEGVKQLQSTEQSEDHVGEASEDISALLISYLRLRFKQIDKWAQLLAGEWKQSVEISADTQPRSGSVQPELGADAGIRNTDGNAQPAALRPLTGAYDVWAGVDGYLNPLQRTIADAQKELASPDVKSPNVLQLWEECRLLLLQGRIEYLRVLAEVKAYPKEVRIAEWRQGMELTAPILLTLLKQALAVSKETGKFGEAQTVYMKALREYGRALTYVLQGRVQAYVSSTSTAFITNPALAELVKAGIASDVDRLKAKLATIIADMRKLPDEMEVPVNSNPNVALIKSLLKLVALKLQAQETVLEWLRTNFQDDEHLQEIEPLSQQVGSVRAQWQAAHENVLGAGELQDAVIKVEQEALSMDNKLKEYLGSLLISKKVQDLLPPRRVIEHHIVADGVEVDDEHLAPVVEEHGRMGLVVVPLPKLTGAVQSPPESPDADSSSGVGSLISVLLSGFGPRDDDQPDKALGKLEVLRTLLVSSALAISLLVAILTGLLALYFTNPTFGSLRDYVTAFLWGFTIPNFTVALGNLIGKPVTK